ncbi:hypothetical protein CLORY_44090 [Clostridium oryzae]|uniref:Uncharacterized protein n=1 Tax=Clostridium oryzae TaxID=1450648 RepID=A0A1V4I6B1_9CLOT|nr:hypothetical protein [Clostridium oryzae]OPJ55506.1 hypothetical protein CLORY_44090 [Clostridium oryzae]
MRDFVISSIMILLLIFLFFYIFKLILPGPFRHKIYEKIMSSFAKFVIYVFFISVFLNCLLAFIIYRFRYVAYINIIIPSILSIVVGFIASTVPVKGTESKNKNIES